MAPNNIILVHNYNNIDENVVPFEQLDSVCFLPKKDGGEEKLNLRFGSLIKKLKFEIILPFPTRLRLRIRSDQHQHRSQKTPQVPRKLF